MSEHYYTQAQAAELIGVSQAMISRYTKPDKITGKAKLANIRLGRRVLISDADLQAFLQFNRVASANS